MGQRGSHVKKRRRTHRHRSDARGTRTRRQLRCASNFHCSVDLDQGLLSVIGKRRPHTSSPRWREEGEGARMLPYSAAAPYHPPPSVVAYSVPPIRVARSDQTQTREGAMTRTAADLVEQAKKCIEAVTPEQLAAEMHAGEVVIVDVRDSEERRHGYIPGSIHVPRVALEFAADPTSPFADSRLHPAQRVVLHCGLGLGSALATGRLRRWGTGPQLTARVATRPGSAPATRWSTQPDRPAAS
jgi:rhodanese-related sulfurtransferase